MGYKLNFQITTTADELEQFVWVGNSASPEQLYSNWDSGQPDVGGPCVSVTELGLWRDGDCNGVDKPYVCQQYPATGKIVCFIDMTNNLCLVTYEYGGVGSFHHARDQS